MKSLRGLHIWTFNGAVALVTIWLVLHALGWRECVSVLSGTMPNGWSRETVYPCALAYLLAYFGAVLVAPALLLASLFCRLLNRVKA